MDTVSLWEKISTRNTHYPQLSNDIEVDTAIIGGGITGITAALSLVKAGKKVAVLEAGQMGGVTTAYSTGNLYMPVQPFYQNIASKFDFETAKTIARSRQFAIDYMEKVAQEMNIPCQFSRRPWYGYTADHERISLDKEIDLMQKMEIPIEYVKELPLKFKYKKAVRLLNQARLNPLQYVISIAEELAKQGCLLFENTRVLDIHERKEDCVLETKNGKITARKVLMATHIPIGINLKQIFTAPYRSYIVSVKLQDDHYPEGQFWDLDRPPHSTCTQAVSSNHPELLMVAGSHHKVGQGGETHVHYKELEQFLREHFPVAEVTHQWSAQHYQSADCVPYMGLASRSAKNVYIATGYFADGLVYGTLAGLIFADLVLGNENALANTYQSNRLDLLASAKFLMKENSNVFMQYLKDFPWISARKYDDIKKGQGKIVEINQEKYAISRDDENKLQAVSAVCTHMKGIVNWNEAEKTWDCPCHGSRFTAQGKVIEGPAITDLKKMMIKED